MSVTIRTENSIAVVTVDNPPVNALSIHVRQELLDALATTESDDNITAVVLECSGRTFIAGADIREFGLAPQPPHLPDVINEIESASKPWVAAIHGTALGGGLEVALGCHFRLADQNAKMGLPEVTLGLIPGAGATIRLPRLVGVSIALDIMSSGKPICAAKAHTIGLVDQISIDNLSKQAIEFARHIDSSPQPLSLKALTPPDDVDAFEQQIKKISGRARGQLAPLAVIQAVQNAMCMTAADALCEERALFLDLKQGEQSAAMRHIFFAERSAARIPELKDISPYPLQLIGIIGGGTMGSGIAASCLLSGLQIILIEQSDTACAKASERIANILSQSLQRGLIDEVKHSQLLSKLDINVEYNSLGNCDLVVEAVFEDIDVKKDVFTKLDNVVKPECILASNTSYLDVNEIAQSSAYPERVIGLHFFSPAHIMKLMELIMTSDATPKVLATAVALAKTLKKICVPAGVCDGFIGNRIMSEYRRECEFMIEDGALPWEIDAAMRDYGYSMGLFEVQDLAGLDIAWAMRKRQAATRDPNQRYVAIADKLCEAGRLGRKTGKGWYRYNNGKTETDTYVTNLIETSSAQKGITRVAHSPELIMERILKSMRSTANELINEGIALCENDIDVVMVNGYGFPRHKGGPVFSGRSNE